MKNYFGFSLTGKKMFPIWLALYVLFIAPFVVLCIKMSSIETDLSSGSSSELAFVWKMYAYMAILIIIVLLISYFIAKMVIENIQYNNLTIGFNGKFMRYLGVVLLGSFLTVITLGIYYSWFIKNLERFYVNNSALENESFEFKGKGGKLFLIYLLAFFIPLFIMIGLTIKISTLYPGLESSCTFGYVGIVEIVWIIIVIPFMYLYYKWMVNIDYKNYNIRFDTKFWNSCGKIALEMFLSIITVGIYSPAAWIKLYKYFVDRTVAKSDEAKRSFGFEADNWNDFLYIWGQTLLTIITVGLYSPWCICKVNKRILSRTYLE